MTKIHYLTRMRMQSLVFSGYVRLPSPNTPYSFAGQDTYLRLQRAIWLYKHWRPLPILSLWSNSEGDVYGKRCVMCWNPRASLRISSGSSLDHDNTTRMRITEQTFYACTAFRALHWWSRQTAWPERRRPFGSWESTLFPRRLLIHI